MNKLNKTEWAAYMRQYLQTNDSANLKTRIYHIVRRCYDPSFKDYHNYGGRGITVCDDWRSDPENFVAWALSNGWKRGLQIDRIDNDGPYEPGNCQWTTSKENNRNRRNNKLDVEKVSEIRKLLAQGVRGTTIAAMFHVHHSLIYRIKLKQQWI